MALVVGIVASSKGKYFIVWFMLGLLLWPIALVIVLVAPATEKSKEDKAYLAGRVPCPFCAEMIKPEANVCPFCQRDLPSATEQADEPDPMEGVDPRISRTEGGKFAVLGKTFDTLNRASTFLEIMDGQSAKK